MRSRGALISTFFHLVVWCSVHHQPHIHYTVLGTRHSSTLLFCTSDSSAALLAQEGITNGVHVVGDVMYDAVLHYHESSSMAPPRADDYALLTMHRAENVDDRQRLDNIVRALAAIEMKIYF